MVQAAKKLSWWARPATDDVRKTLGCDTLETIFDRNVFRVTPQFMRWAMAGNNRVILALDSDTVTHCK
jgi:hypothetical protein